MEQNRCPFIVENLIASAVDALKVLGDARAIAVLVAGDCRLHIWDSNYGSNDWRLSVALPVSLYYAITEDDRNATELAIAEVVRSFFMNLPCDSLESVAIIPLVVQAQEGWREEALRFVKGEGVTNQGRVRSDNIASQQYQGLLFRSKAEITLFMALTRAQLAVAPLPVFVRIGKISLVSQRFHIRCS